MSSSARDSQGVLPPHRAASLIFVACSTAASRRGSDRRSHRDAATSHFSLTLQKQCSVRGQRRPKADELDGLVMNLFPISSFDSPSPPFFGVSLLSFFPLRSAPHTCENTRHPKQFSFFGANDERTLSKVGLQIRQRTCLVKPLPDETLKEIPRAHTIRYIIPSYSPPPPLKLVDESHEPAIESFDRSIRPRCPALAPHPAGQKRLNFTQDDRQRIQPWVLTFRTDYLRQ